MDSGSRPSKNGAAAAGAGKAKGRKPLPSREPDADDVKRLVLDYLSHSCFLSTARALSKPPLPSAPSHPTSSPPIAGPSSTSAESPAPSSSFTAARPADDFVPSDPNGEDVQMMSESVVLNGHGKTNGAAAAAAARNDPNGNDLMAVDGEGGSGVATTMTTNGHAALNGDATTSSESVSRPSVRFNPSLKVNGKSPAGPGGEFESVNALYAGALSVEELNRIEQRGLIRAQILQGNIHSAMSLIQTYFPAYFSSSETTDDSADSFRSPLVAKPPAASDPSLASSLDADGPTPARRTARPRAVISFKPAHMQLNLLIQSFVETLRTVPVGPAHDAIGRGSSPGASLTAASSPASSIHSASSAVSASSSSALAQAKSLYMAIDQLEEGTQKEWYQREVFGAASLLAYAPAESADPETRSYLDFSRREALADQINSALLVHIGQHSSATIDVMSRQTSFVWERLSHHNVDPVPPWTKEDGVEWERLGQYFRQNRQFHLGQFLES